MTNAQRVLITLPKEIDGCHMASVTSVFPSTTQLSPQRCLDPSPSAAPWGMPCPSDHDAWARDRFPCIGGSHIGRALFKHGEPSDPELQRRYRLYKALEAALALPAGPQRLEALHKAYRELRAN